MSNAEVTISRDTGIVYVSDPAGQWGPFPEAPAGQTLNEALAFAELVRRDVGDGWTPSEVDGWQLYADVDPGDLTIEQLRNELQENQIRNA